jgi:hypothetical protein
LQVHSKHEKGEKTGRADIIIPIFLPETEKAPGSWPCGAPAVIARTRPRASFFPRKRLLGAPQPLLVKLPGVRVIPEPAVGDDFFIVKLTPV